MDIIKSDVLNTSIPSFPKDTKSISLTRNIAYDDCVTGTRFALDYDKLAANGYLSKPFDEVGYALGSVKSDKFKDYRKYKRQDITNMPFESEERIYKDVKNLGKYIIYIDVQSIKYNGELLTDYIKKYPHIIVRQLQCPQWKEPKVILDINMINNKEKLVKQL